MTPDKLTPRELEALTLRLQGLTYRQTAEAMKTTEGTVKQYLHRANNKVMSVSASSPLPPWESLK